MVSYCCFWEPRRPMDVGHVQMVKGEQLISIQDMLGMLVRPEVGSVVIQGIGGSGKTWAAKAAYQTARTSNLFDDYIWVSLSINCSLRRCVEKIAACLFCDIREDLSVQRTKTVIKDYLTRQKFLLVLDNAYFTEENILEHLGVPHPRQQNIGSKVIVTTRTGRTEMVMVPDVVIMPQPLTYEGSYDLLCKKIGKDISEESYDLLCKKIREDINSHTDLISNCYGIPLLIILLAGALCYVPRQESFGELVNNACAAVGSKISVFKTMQRLVKFGYHQLPNQLARHCFLYCFLFPEDQGIPVKDLIHFWIMDGIVQEARDFDEANCIGKEILDVLLKHGMIYLEDNDHVRMHDVIRETLSGLGEDNNYIEQHDFDNPTIKLEHLAELSSRISLMNTEMEYLHGSPQCFWISSLLLRGNYHMKAVSEEFFCSMGMLEILDLSFTRIKVLPPSISCLTRLRMLLLIGCDHLEEIQHIGSLALLEVLDASGCSSLKSIDSESFGSMVLLKVLDLSTTSIKRLPSLPTSVELRHLLLQGCPCLGSEQTIRPNAMLSESKLIDFPYGLSKTGAVQSLQLGRIGDLVDWMAMLWLPCGLTFQLSDMFDMIVSFDINENSKTYVYASDACFFHSLKKDSPLWFNCFRKFQIVISALKDDQSPDTDAQVMKTDFIFRNSYFRTKHFAHSIDLERFLEINGTIGVPSDIDGILHHAELISLKRITVTTQVSDLNFRSMAAVREVWIENCDQLDSLLSLDEVQALSAMGTFHNLWISNMENLSSFCKGVKDVTSFSCLRHLLLDCCPNLTHLFPSMLRLPNLETLHIRFCDILQSVFDNSVLGEDALPRLRSLQLWELPELTCICGGVLPCLKNLKVRSCAKLRKIPVGVNENSPLVTTRGETLWWDSLIWDDESIKRWVLFRNWGPLLPHLGRPQADRLFADTPVPNF